MSDPTPVDFYSDATRLAAWHYPPDEPGTRDAPVIVLAHGFAALKEMGLDAYARAFTEAGFAAVVFDHPTFGQSEGEPRHEVDPERQLRAYRHAISLAQALPGIDGDRVGVWGTSFSGGHALVLAATDGRVGAAVAQVPYVGPPVDEPPSELLAVLQDDEERRRGGAAPATIPVTAAEGEGIGALSADPAAHAWFTRMAGAAPGWRNEVTLRSLAHLFLYRPGDLAAEVTAPTLLIAARDDVLCPLAQIDDVANRLPAPSEELTVAGGHFDAYGSAFGVTSQAAVGWFCRWLEP